MYRCSLGLLIGLCNFGAHAQEVSQWRVSMYSMFELVSQGYELKAYSDNTPSSPPAFGHSSVVYFLQKDRELIQCVEYKSNPSATFPRPRPSCSTLVKPN